MLSMVREDHALKNYRRVMRWGLYVEVKVCAYL